MVYYEPLQNMIFLVSARTINNKLKNNNYKKGIN